MILGIIIGILIGAPAGMIIAGLMAMSSRYDEMEFKEEAEINAEDTEKQDTI